MVAYGNHEMTFPEAVVIAVVLLITFAGATHIAVGLLGRTVPFPALQSALSPPHQHGGTLRLVGLVAAILVSITSQVAIIGGLLGAPTGGIAWVYSLEFLLAIGWGVYLGRFARRRAAD